MKVALVLRAIIVFGLVWALGVVIMSIITLAFAVQYGSALVTTPLGEGPAEIVMALFACLILSYLICRFVVRGGHR